MISSTLGQEHVNNRFLHEVKAISLEIMLEAFSSSKGQNAYQNIGIIRYSVIPYNPAKTDVAIIIQSKYF